MQEQALAPPITPSTCNVFCRLTCSGLRGATDEAVLVVSGAVDLAEDEHVAHDQRHERQETGDDQIVPIGGPSLRKEGARGCKILSFFCFELSVMCLTPKVGRGPIKSLSR